MRADRPGWLGSRCTGRLPTRSGAVLASEEEASVADGSLAHVAPRAMVVWMVLRAEVERRAAAGDMGRLAILDLGGGSGVFAVPLAELGHVVTVVDISPDALATLQRRAAEAGVAHRVTAVPGDVERMPEEIPVAAYDLVLCHGLLQIVDDAEETLATVAGRVRPGGCASVLVTSRAAAVVARALGGHPADALRTLTDPDGRWGPGDVLRRRFDTDELKVLVAGAGLVVEAVHGARIFTDLVPGALLDGVPGAAEALRELEFAASGLPPYRDIATQLHVLARRP
jgi:S-adenosylmethionine-dependent methyltransferase